MRILAMSHSCVTDVNQQLFLSLRAIPNTEVSVIVPTAWRHEYADGLVTPTRLAGADFPMHFLPVGKPGNVVLHYYKKLPANLFKEWRPDIMLSTQEPYSLSGMQALQLARRLRIPFLFQTNQNIEKRYPLPFRLIESQHYRSSTVGCAFSEEARQVLVRKGFRGRSEVVPYGIDISLFAPNPSIEFRRDLGLDDAFVIGYMGRFVPEKGLDDFIRAFQIVCEQRPSANLRALFVGSGAEEANLRRIAAECGVADRCVFPGSVPHIRAGEYMNCMDAFVLPSRTTPSWKEQFGRVIIESMACGIPVAGSDSGQIPYLIRETGGGVVFREGDIADIAEKLLTLVDDPAAARRIGMAGRDVVHERYTFDAVARQIHRICEEILSDSKAAAVAAA